MYIYILTGMAAGGKVGEWVARVSIYKMVRK
jgi:hypothetical protein